jgi:putative autoinducer-2 (AI-2) aldolase
MADVEGLQLPEMPKKKKAVTSAVAKGPDLSTLSGISYSKSRKMWAVTGALKKEDSYMDWGLKNRLSRIIKPETGRTVMLAVDHGYFLGPTAGLEEPAGVIAPLLPYADCLMPARGVLRMCVDAAAAYNTSISLRVSGTNSILKELSNEDLTVSMEDAIRLNVSAVAISIYVGAEYQERTLKNLARLVDEGQRYGIPVLAVTAVGKELGKDARYLSLACRIAAEIGAHFVKTYYCKDFERVVRTCPVPLVMAGGKKIPEPDALKLTSNAVKRGASGVDMGRNIFQAEDPVAMIQAVRAVVHNNMSPKRAYELYRDLKARNKRRKKR